MEFRRGPWLGGRSLAARFTLKSKASISSPYPAIRKTFSIFGSRTEGDFDVGVFIKPSTGRPSPRLDSYRPGGLLRPRAISSSERLPPRPSASPGSLKISRIGLEPESRPTSQQKHGDDPSENFTVPPLLPSRIDDRPGSISILPKFLPYFKKSLGKTR